MTLKMIDGEPRGRSPVAYYDDPKGEEIEWRRGRRRKKRGRDWSESRNRTESGDGTPTEWKWTVSRERSKSNQRLTGLMTYPPYMPIPGAFQSSSHSPPRKSESDSRGRRRVEMMKGSTCKLVMQLTAEYRTVENAITMLLMPSVGCEDVLRWEFKKNDIQAVVQRCRDYGLGAWSPLLSEAEEWDEEIEELKKSKRWWEEEDERSSTNEPVEVGERGWWSQIENKDNRDWCRWRSLDIGSRGRNKKIRDEEGDLEMDEDF